VQSASPGNRKDYQEAEQTTNGTNQHEISVDKNKCKL
jgi:hypothetical protein